MYWMFLAKVYYTETSDKRCSEKEVLIKIVIRDWNFYG